MLDVLLVIHQLLLLLLLLLLILHVLLLHYLLHVRRKSVCAKQPVTHRLSVYGHPLLLLLLLQLLLLLRYDHAVIRVQLTHEL